MNHVKSLSFAVTHKDFFSTLNQRVHLYFRQNGIDRTANREMFIKTLLMFALYFIPYGLIVSGFATSFFILLLLYLTMGVGIAGIGLSVMHDANHGSYSKRPWINSILGYSLNLIGGHATNWKVQHNMLHHTYTNVHDADEDISPRGVLRLAPGSAWKPAHRYQHWYAWPLYGLLTLAWVFAKDFSRLIKYQRNGLLHKQGTTALREWSILILSKAIYLFYIMGIPAWLLPFAWWKVVIAFIAMHAVAGFMLSVIFQPAHVTEGTEYPEPDPKGRLENSWAVHQLRTTTNFAPDRRFFSWFVGGLNYQIEHHLFPNICHVHYRKISLIVEQTAREFNLPYRSVPSFRKALILHARLLRKLGEKP